MKQYYYVTYKKDIQIHLEQILEGLTADNYTQGKVIRADSPDLAKVIFLKKDYAKATITLEELYHLFLEDYCYYGKSCSGRIRLEPSFSHATEISAMLSILPSAETYEIGFEPEVENEMMQICPYNEFLRLFPTESDLSELYAYANGYKVMACV